jgi:hypothetical protein
MSSLKIYDTGAWTLHEIKANGSASRDARGCLDKKQLAALRDDLKTISWKIDPTKAHCMAISSWSADYTVHGKVVYTARMCGEALTDPSEKKLGEINSIVDAITKVKP